MIIDTDKIIGKKAYAAQIGRLPSFVSLQIFGNKLDVVTFVGGSAILLDPSGDLTKKYEDLIKENELLKIKLDKCKNCSNCGNTIL